MHEPGLPELVTKNAERLHFTTDMGEVLENASLLFCCVDTPPTYSGDADLSRVEAVIGELGDSEGHAIVMKSTVPVGTGRSIMRRFPDVGYVSNPEFLKEGSAVKDFMNPDRVVIGADDGSEEFADRVAALYDDARRRPVCAPTWPAPRWSSWPPTPSWPRRSPSSTRSRTSPRSWGRTCPRWRGVWGSTTASARSSCRRASATAAAASRRT